MMRSIPVLALGLALAPVSGHAAAGSDSSARLPRVVYQDTVVVSSSKLHLRLPDLATSATVVSPAELRRSPARQTQDALTMVPGAHVADLSGNETQGVVEARGFASQGTSSHVLVLVDEIPINDLEGDRVDWTLVAPSQIERIEFLRGPASFLYGDASMAGVVNLVTRPAGAGASEWFEGGGGSKGRASLAGGSAWSGARANGTLSLSHQQLDGMRNHSAWHSTGGYGAARVALGSGWSMGARLLGHHGEQEVPGPLPEPDWRITPDRSDTPSDHRNDDTYDGALQLGGTLGPRLESTTLVTSDVRDIDARETVFPTGAMDRDSRLRALGGETRMHWMPGGTLAHVLLGASVTRGTLRSRYHDSAQANALVGAADVRRTSGGAYALAQLRVREPLALTAGGRMDWLRSDVDDPTDAAPRGTHDDLRAFSPTVGLNLALPRGGNAYASYDGSFKAPTLEQLYDARPYTLDFDGPGGDPPVTLHVTNHALQPQRGDHVEVGVRGALARGAWLEGTGYYVRSREEIGFDLANFRYSNIDRSRHYGFEGRASVLASRLAVDVSYAYTRARFDGGAHDGKQINTVPEHQAGTRWTLTHPWGGSATVEGLYVWKQWIDEDNLVALPDYGVVHLALAQRAGRVELFANVRNLFDHRYATLGYVAFTPLYFPAAGRTFQAGLRWSGGVRGGAGT